jgi:hypothetical protein
MKTDYFDPQIKSRPPFRILRKVIGDRVPWRAIIDKSMKLRPNSWIIIERAHANRHLRSVGQSPPNKLEPQLIQNAFTAPSPFR